MAELPGALPRRLVMRHTCMRPSPVSPLQPFPIASLPAPPPPPRVPLCTLRGFRVRMGMSSGLAPGHDVIWTKRSGRVAYSGHCMQLTRLVSDAGIGGMLLLASDTWALLQPWPEALAGAKPLHYGRYCLYEKDLGPDAIDVAIADALVPRATQHAAADAADAAAAAAAMVGAPTAFGPVPAVGGSGDGNGGILPLRPHTRSSTGSATARHGRSSASNGPLAPHHYKAAGGGSGARLTDVFVVTNAALLARLPYWDRLPGGCSSLRCAVQVLPGIMEAPLGPVAFCKVGGCGKPLLSFACRGKGGLRLGGGTHVQRAAQSSLRTAGRCLPACLSKQ